MKTLILISLLSLLNMGCSKDFSETYPYNPPQNIGDGLLVGTMEELQIDTLMILKASERIHNAKYGEVHSLLIYKDNKLVFEEYYPGHRYKWDAPAYHGELVNWDRSMAHEMMSVTKSVTSACIGIAIDIGFIESVHQSIFDYLPDHQHLKVDNREYITIEHLVTMTLGLAWDEWSVAHGSSANDIDGLWFDCEETISCVLERSWWQEPGKLFTYNGGGMAILSEIIKNATHMNIDEFSMKYLFEPLGIEKTQWTQFPGGVWDGSGSFYITPRDMIKFGVTYLNKGEWNGERIISPEWVEKSSTPFANNIDINIPGEDSGKNGYGYTWWTSELTYSGHETKMFRAGGWGGQEIMVFPELDMVVVFTGGNYAVKTHIFEIVERFILPAINH
ncbi:serine hydrolase domain-containing protein [Bacteroidota bacterium]